MVARRGRSTKRKPKQQQNSNINAAQQAAREKKLDAKKVAERPAPKNKPIETGLPATKLEPRNGTPMANSGRGVDQGSIAKRDNSLSKGINEATQKIAGLTVPMVKEAHATAAAQKPLADAKFYGTSDKAIADRLVALRNEQISVTTRQLKTKGNAVFLGSKKQTIRKEIRGGDFEGGQNRTPQEISVDDIRSADELMSWLADEKTFNQIRDAAKKSGIDVKSYDDVAKVWEQVVKQAAATYSTTGKKVTPWALLQLRGKSMVNGKPAAKTTTSSNIESMDPAQAKVMLKNSLAQMLGRDPRQSEIEDFISKAQTIAKQNPNVTTTTTQYDFAGDPVSQSSTSKGGSDVVSAKAQLEAEHAAESAPDYAQYQAAGVYAPWMFEALSSPI